MTPGQREKLKEKICGVVWDSFFEADKTTYTEDFTLVDAVEECTEKILQEVEKVQ